MWLNMCIISLWVPLSFIVVGSLTTFRLGAEARLVKPVKRAHGGHIYNHGFWYLVVSALLILLMHGLQAGFSDSDVVNLVGIYIYIYIYPVLRIIPPPCLLKYALQ